MNSSGLPHSCRQQSDFSHSHFYLPSPVCYTVCSMRTCLHYMASLSEKERSLGFFQFKKIVLFSISKDVQDSGTFHARRKSPSSRSGYSSPFLSRAGRQLDSVAPGRWHCTEGHHHIVFLKAFCSRRANTRWESTGVVAVEVPAGGSQLRCAGFDAFWLQFPDPVPAHPSPDGFQAVLHHPGDESISPPMGPAPSATVMMLGMPRALLALADLSDRTHPM